MSTFWDIQYVQRDACVSTRAEWWQCECTVEEGCKGPRADTVLDEVMATDADADAVGALEDECRNANCDGRSCACHRGQPCPEYGPVLREIEKDRQAAKRRRFVLRCAACATGGERDLRGGTGIRHSYDEVCLAKPPPGCPDCDRECGCDHPNDDDPEKIRAAFEDGDKGVTAPPDRSVHHTRAVACPTWGPVIVGEYPHRVTSYECRCRRHYPPCPTVPGADGDVCVPDGILGEDVTQYYCPTSGSIESSCHGGFDVCCDRPELHRPLPPGCQPQDCCGDPGAHEGKVWTSDKSYELGGTMPPARTHECETSRCWQECRNADDAVPVTLSPRDDGGRCSYGSKCCPGHTTEKKKERGGILATARRWIRIIFTAGGPTGP